MDIPGGMFAGKAILVKGTVVDSTADSRFIIDLCCGRLVQGDHRVGYGLTLRDECTPFVGQQGAAYQSAIRQRWSMVRKRRRAEKDSPFSNFPRESTTKLWTLLGSPNRIGISS